MAYFNYSVKPIAATLKIIAILLFYVCVLCTQTYIQRAEVKDFGCLLLSTSLQLTFLRQSLIIEPGVDRFGYTCLAVSSEGLPTYSLHQYCGDIYISLPHTFYMDFNLGPYSCMLVLYSLSYLLHLHCKHFKILRSFAFSITKPHLHDTSPMLWFLISTGRNLLILLEIIFLESIKLSLGN